MAGIMLQVLFSAILFMVAVASVDVPDLASCTFPDVTILGQQRVAPVIPIGTHLAVCGMDPPSQCNRGECQFNRCWDKLPRTLYVNETATVPLYVPARDGTRCFGMNVCMSGNCIHSGDAENYGIHPFAWFGGYRIMQRASFTFDHRGADVIDDDDNASPGIFGRPLCVDTPACLEYRDSIVSPMDQKPDHLTLDFEINECLRMDDGPYWSYHTGFSPLGDGTSCKDGTGECFAGRCFYSTFPPYCHEEDMADTLHCSGTAPPNAYAFNV